MPPALTTTHRSVVTEEQIDHLGHMNVRFYAENAIAATRTLLDELSGPSHGLVIDDTYTRHRREQLLGAELEVRSGVVGIDDSRVRIYHELVNGDDEVAATFVHGCRGAMAGTAIEAARALQVDIPEHGRPRSISLDDEPLAAAPTHAAASDAGLAMRHPRAVAADECDDEGRYRMALAPMLTWGGEPVDDSSGPMLHANDDGSVVVGWAAMETRLVVGRLPSLGTQIQAFGAPVEVNDKTVRRVHWTFAADTGELLCCFEGVSLAFDTVGRRAVSIPDAARRTETERMERYRAALR